MSPMLSRHIPAVVKSLLLVTLIILFSSSLIMTQPLNTASAQSTEVINPANVGSLTSGTHVLLDFNNFPNPVDGQAIPSGYAGLTWSSLVEGEPWAGISTWGIYIANGGLSGSITFPVPVKVVSLRVGAAGSTAFTLSSPGNPDVHVSASSGQPQTVTTNWVNPATTFTLRASTNDQTFDDLRFVVAGGASTITPTRTVTPTNSPTRTVAPTNSPTRTVTPTSSPTRTVVPTNSPTRPPTQAATATRTPTPSPTRTSTPLPPTATAMPPTSTPTTTQPKVYWGALLDGARVPATEELQPGGVYDLFEQRAQKKMSIYHWGQAWKINGQYARFQTEYYNNTRSRGAIPLVDWGSWYLGQGTNQPDYQLSDIYNGVHDAYLTQWALDAKAWGHPFFLRLDWEMNGNWQFPWSEQLNGNQPGDFVKAWRHVHDIFTQNSVKNVTWVWCPNISGETTRPMAQLYPGDSYVDWTCLDGYNKDSTWITFNTVFTGQGITWIKDSYNEILTVAPNKPLMLGEFASLEAGDGGAKKAAWIRDAFLAQLPQNFPKVKAVVWFNWNDNNPSMTFPIESSTASISAFADGVRTSYYATNNYANLNQSPIPALP